MLVSLGFLLVIVVMSAFLAVLADNVGRKLGKSRRSLKTRHLNLRPRHVASIGTALTGVLVSLATMGFVALVSKDVRDWIVRGRAAIAQAEALTERNQTLSDQIRRGESRITSQNSTIRKQGEAIQKQEGEAQKAAREIRAGKQEVERQRKTAERLRSEIQKLQTALEVGRKNVQVATERVEKLRAEIPKLRGRLQVLDNRLALNAKKYDLVTKDLKEITSKNTELLAGNLTLQSQGEALRQSITDLSKARDELEATRDQAIEQLALTQRELSERQRELVDAQTDLKSAQQRLQVATIEGMRYFSIGASARTNPVTFQAGEEVARLSLDEGLSRAKALESMNNLLRKARLAAIAKGAQPNDEYPEAGIFERRDPQTRETVSGEVLTTRIVQQTVGRNQPLVLIAYSSLNAFRGEPVSLDVVVYPNPLVYKSGQLVAEARIDGRKDEAEIVKQVQQFLGPQLTERARQDRLIPRGSDELPKIEVPEETFVRIVNEVKSAERTVRLLALAAGETRAADPLKLNFQIR